MLKVIFYIKLYIKYNVLYRIKYNGVVCETYIAKLRKLCSFI